MLKEIAEQPERLRDALIGKANTVQRNITLFAFLQYDKKLKKASRFIICGCGTSFFSGLLGRLFIENFGRVPVVVESASQNCDRESFIFLPDVV